ncbi:MAG TPA: hypothetical protein VNC61_17650 [Acidimicrobiales bacterium]|nr:hypothetical protein [Acidimicrobiales bacterium]
MNNAGTGDLDFVRRQLDDLGLGRAMGTMTEEDRARYDELCDRERLLLHRGPHSAGRVLAGSLRA